MVKSLDNGKDRGSFPGDSVSNPHGCLYPSTVALRDCEFGALPEDFSTYLRTNPDIAIGMVPFFWWGNWNARTQVTSMSFKDARREGGDICCSALRSRAPDQQWDGELDAAASARRSSERFWSFRRKR